MIGKQLAHYEITGHLGTGGMGQVYQAKDARLGRSVAIKILPEQFAGEAERVARFEREARVLAALNHSHIAAIHGLEHSGEQTFLVMELVPGQTLAEWIAQHRKKPASTTEVLSIARQIAEAFEAAHQAGVIHRDLKPANIMITPDGTVKVLDFGLAKVAAPFSESDLSNSPTISNLTANEAGVILGTAAYMSPEQAKGRAVDKRSDIWSFGCVLYEMLTGSRLFAASDVSDTLAAVLMREPDWTRLPADVPTPIRLLLRRCLERDRAKRLSDIAGALFAIDEALNPLTVPGELAVTLRAKRPLFMGWLAPAILAAAGVIAVWFLLHRAPDEGPPLHFQIASDAPFEVAPDGRSVILFSNQLMLRRFDSDEETLLAGTEGAYYAFWSPDSQSIAFFQGSSLRRIDLKGGVVRTLASAPNARPGSWNVAGEILFSTSSGPLFKVSAEAGAVEQVTVLKPGQSSHRFSQFLPDGRRFLFLALGDEKVRGVYLGSLDSKDTKRVLEGEFPFRFFPPNYILVCREGALWVQEFDVESGETRGEQRVVAPRVLEFPVDATGEAAISVSPSGVLAYRPSGATRQFLWLDRQGRQLGLLGEPEKFLQTLGGWSPDGVFLALTRTVKGEPDVWLLNAVNGAIQRLTLTAGYDEGGAFSPDATRLAFNADRLGALDDIYEKRIDGTGPDTLLVSSPDNDQIRDWSPDGRYIVYIRQSPKTDYDIWAMPLFGDRKSFPVAEGPLIQGSPQFSPDGHWIVFNSSESGSHQLYLQPFPGPGPKIQVTYNGGFFARWLRNSTRELVYQSGNKIMSVALSERGASFVANTPHELMTLIPGDSWTLPPDGRRILVSRITENQPPISIVLNWKPPQK